jgi:hypothetical protein
MGNGSVGLRVKRPLRGANHPPPPSAEVKERVELYLYSPSGSSWLVLGRTLHVVVAVPTGTNIYISVLCTALTEFRAVYLPCWNLMRAVHNVGRAATTNISS